MKTLLLSLTFTGIITYIQSDISYQNNYEEADYFCQSIQSDFEKIAAQYGLNFNEVIPIVFPECTRFNQFSDQLESTALEYLYVHYGSTSANFSIGYFQMKPSFIESLELSINSGEFSSTIKNHFLYDSAADNKTKREIRMLRLRDIEWQIHYLCAFYKIMEQRTINENWVDKADQVAFFAAAYNYGFLENIQDIKSWQNQEKFPDTSSGMLRAYSDIAKSYYFKITGHEN